MMKDDRKIKQFFCVHGSEAKRYMIFINST